VRERRAERLGADGRPDGAVLRVLRGTWFFTRGSGELVRDRPMCPISTG